MPTRTKPAPPRPAQTRGEETRSRLLDKALRLFADKGYKAVSTRAIAQAAGVNHAAIGFHFRNKSGLHQAVVDDMAREFSRICQSLHDRIAPALGAAPEDMGQAIGPAVEEFVTAAAATERLRLFNRLYQQEQLTASPAAGLIHDRVAGPLLDTLEDLAVAAKAAERGFDSKALAVSLLGLLTAYGREADFVSKHLGQTADSPEFINALARAAALGARGMLGV